MVLAYVALNSKIEMAIKQLNVDCIVIDDSVLSFRMKEIQNCDYKGILSYPGFIYIQKEDANQMDQIQSAFRPLGIERFGMETDVNRNWSLKKLLDEIEKEHAYFLLRERVQNALKYPNPLRMKDSNYMKEYNRMVQDFKSKNLTEFQLKNILFRLSKL